MSYYSFHKQTPSYLHTKKFNKQVSMIKKYNNQTLHGNQCHLEEEP